ncbi:hypothetical protein RTBOTA2_005115 [Rhodotorula toruloides]|nr:hypothetical protein RTBOTA2_005115 [Rhodotorula toruloides]
MDATSGPAPSKEASAFTEIRRVAWGQRVLSEPGGTDFSGRRRGQTAGGCGGTAVEGSRATLARFVLLAWHNDA